MSLLYEQINTKDYICFGVALCANIQGLIITPILLKKDLKRNIVVVLANVFYFTSNMINFSQRSISNCDAAGYLVQLLLILGSILEVHTPMIRAYWLLNTRMKKIIPVVGILMILFQFLVLIDMSTNCNDTSQHFLVLSKFNSAQLVSDILSIILLYVAFRKIIELIDKSEFVKVNAKMQLLRSLAKYSLVCVISVKVCQSVLETTGFWRPFDFLNNGALVIALRSNLIVVLMVSQLTLELTKASDDVTEKSDSTGKHDDSSVGPCSKDHSRRTSNSSAKVLIHQKPMLKKPDHIVEVENEV